MGVSPGQQFESVLFLIISLVFQRRFVVKSEDFNEDWPRHIVIIEASWQKFMDSASLRERTGETREDDPARPPHLAGSMGLSHVGNKTQDGKARPTEKDSKSRPDRQAQTRQTANPDRPKTDKNRQFPSFLGRDMWRHYLTCESGQATSASVRQNRSFIYSVYFFLSIRYQMFTFSFTPICIDKYSLVR